MNNIEKQREKLLKKLKELFQLDQPDLDFGFYRIMQSRKEQITNFIDKELLSYIREAFTAVDASQIAALQAELEREIQTAKEYGAADPENSPRVLDAKIRLKQAKDTGNIEAEIYDHLFRFFERYYEDGDFISRRYYSRETESRAAAYAIPYSGEEVSLHWANKDQYYVKSSDYFTNYRFSLSEAFQKHLPVDALQTEADFSKLSLAAGLYVSFVITDASEGDHGDIKSSENDKRFFIIRKDKPLKLISPTELEIYFEYRSDPAKGSTQENTWREQKILEALEIITQTLQTEPQTADFQKGLAILLPTESDKTRSLLKKYLQQYNSRNTRDYFIHKDLGSFLIRELDFYIKNEIMHLDDIENAEAPRVEEYLSKIKVIRKIATKLIDFLAQLENFQKKLWLKKKFVVQADYCLTLDRIPAALYPAICENEAQIAEWIKLYAIDEIEADAVRAAYSKPLNPDFLKENQYLVLDTRFFDPSFKEELLSSIDNFDEHCDGLLIHSENFQALNLLQERYREQVKCIYIDPPYNTKSSEIIYKNTYRDSSWLSLILDRLLISKKIMHNASSLVIAIDETEQELLGQVITEVYQDWKKVCVAIMHNPRGQQGKNVSYVHEYAYFVYPGDDIKYISDIKRDEVDSRNLRDSGGESDRFDARTCFYPFIVRNQKIVGIGEVPNDGFHPIAANVLLDNGDVEIWPINENGKEKKWRYSVNSVHIILDDLEVKAGRNSLQIYFNKYTGTMRSMWTGAKYDASEYGTKVLQSIIGVENANLFSYPKSLYQVYDTIELQTKLTDLPIILDYFAGSGTTAHAVINLNREDNGKRKYILVEMGDYFDTVLKPRIQKVIYSEIWRDGKPVNRESGISHCFKYLRLESYEDTLNNLELVSDESREAILASNRQFKEDYLLNYFLAVESRQSLLNTDAFIDPNLYQMKIKKAGSDEQILQKINLLETFNYLIGLRLEHIDKTLWLDASFKREPDPELPEATKTRLVLDGALKEVKQGKWWIRKLEGWIPQNPFDPNNGLREKVLIVWRNLTGNLEEDNLILESWFQKNRISTLDREFDAIYVNGSNSLPNLLKEGENWKLRLIEEEFLKAMWSEQGE